MPLKRIYCRNEGKRLHQRAGSGLFSYVGGLRGRKPSSTPQRAPNKPQEPPRNAASEAHNLPPFAPQIQKYLKFCPVEVSQNPDKTPKHSKEILIFAPFQPLLPSFGAISVLRSCRSCADAISLSGPRGRKERQPLCPCCRWS